MDTLTLQSNDPADETASPITITLSVTLADYSSVSAATNSFTVQIICQVTAISWYTVLPASYEHTLIVDPIPVLLAFSATQSPLCGAALTYTLTDDVGMAAPAWITTISDSNLSMTPSTLGLQGTYTFKLTASEPISSTQSPISPIEITLAHPCATTTVIAADIADQVFYAWATSHPSELSVSVPFTSF